MAKAEKKIWAQMYKDFTRSTTCMLLNFDRDFIQGHCTHLINKKSFGESMKKIINEQD